MNEKVRALESAIFAMLDKWTEEPDIDQYFRDLEIVLTMRRELIDAAQEGEIDG